MPWGIAVREGGEVVVAERDANCVSIISRNGEKKSFGTCGAPGQFNSPKGVAVDAVGNILVADFGNHRIQQFSYTGKHLRTVGVWGSGSSFQEALQFILRPTKCMWLTPSTTEFSFSTLTSPTPVVSAGKVQAMESSTSHGTYLLMMMAICMLQIPVTTESRSSQLMGCT